MEVKRCVAWEIAVQMWRSLWVRKDYRVVWHSLQPSQNLSSATNLQRVRFVSTTHPFQYETRWLTSRVRAVAESPLISKTATRMLISGASVEEQKFKALLFVRHDCHVFAASHLPLPIQPITIEMVNILRSIGGLFLGHEEENRVIVSWLKIPVLMVMSLLSRISASLARV